jgi:hypothetical protein
MAPRRCAGTYLVEQFALACIAIFIFATLPLNILFDTLFIQTYGADAVAPRPDMLAPVSPPQVRISIEQL